MNIGFLRQECFQAAMPSSVEVPVCKRIVRGRSIRCFLGKAAVWLENFLKLRRLTLLRAATSRAVVGKCAAVACLAIFANFAYTYAQKCVFAAFCKQLL